MTQLEFIQAIAPLHQFFAQKYGFKIASAGIAQACLESQYGESYKAKHNNFHGLKYRSNRVTVNNGYFTDGGSEQNPDGSYSLLPSSTAWYHFDDMAHGVEGYYQFINTPNYAAVKNATNALTYLQAIKASGYATSLSYVENVFKVVQKWNLTQYDNFNQVQKEDLPDIKIIQSPGIQSLTNKPNRTIKYIVLHYTAGTSSKAGTARGLAAYFNKPTTQASADFIVDEAEIVQYNQNLNNYYTWAVGGNIYPSRSTSLAGRYYGKCTNQNSISIEMCSNKINTATLNVVDDDWFITDNVINNTIKLIKYLMKLYNIDINHVIMHHEVTGKWCPQPWSKNELALTGWYNFLNKIKAGAGSSIAIQPTSQMQPAPAAAFPQVPFLVQVIIPNLNIRKSPNGEKTGKVTGIGKFTIVDVQNGWGKLKSGAGYIYLKNPEYVKF